MRLVIAIGTSFSVGVTDLSPARPARRGIPLFVIDPQGVLDRRAGRRRAAREGRGSAAARLRAGGSRRHDSRRRRAAALLSARRARRARPDAARDLGVGRGPARRRARLHPVAVPAAGAERVQPARADPHRGDDRRLPRRPGAATAAAAIAGADAGFLRADAGVGRRTARRASSGRATSRRRAPAGCGPATTTTCASRASSRACGCSVSTITAGRCIGVSPRSRAITRTRCRRRRWTTGGGQPRRSPPKAAKASAPSSFRASAAAGSPVRATRPGACRPAAARRTRRGTAAAAP